MIQIRHGRDFASGVYQQRSVSRMRRDFFFIVMAGTREILLKLRKFVHALQAM